MFVIRLMLVLCLAGHIAPAAAGGKKNDMAGIAFHVEGDRTDNPKMIFPHAIGGKERVFQRSPVVTAKDFAAFNPFPSQNGEGFGLLLKLKSAPANRVAGVTGSNTGKWLVARVNGRIVDGVIIDRQITDGELVIWKNVSLAEIQALDKKLPRIGEKKPRG